MGLSQASPSTGPASPDGWRPATRDRLLVWAVTDGRAGIENQALGLAEAIARLTPCDLTIKRIEWPGWMRRTPSRFIPAWTQLLATGGEAIKPPWPDIWIGNGRASIPLSIAVRRWSSGRTFVVQLQDPLRPSRLFDLVVPPRHDGLQGENVFPIIGTPHRVTRARLDADHAAFSTLVDPLAHPRVAVLIGGDAKAYRLSDRRAALIGDQVAEAIQGAGGSLMLTFSRRTPATARATLTERLKDLPGVIWDGVGPNPYFAFLAAADAILVTEDSANMPAEAAATGAPVYLVRMDGGQPRRRRFHQDLAARGAARWFEGAIDHWTYAPLAETDRAAAEVLRRLHTGR